VRKRIYAWIAAVYLCLPAAAMFAQGLPPLEKVVDSVDKLFRADSSYAVMEMQIVTPNWQRTLKMRAWSEGTDKTFIRILEPQKERGMATLRMGSEMWNYLPNVQKEIRIPPSMMMSAWMGSDFTNDDLVKEFSFKNDYDFRYSAAQNPEPGTLYIECIPKQGRPIVWGSVLLEVDAATLIPKMEKYFDQKGALMRVMNFTEIKTFGDRRIPSVMELIPQNKAGNKTVVRYLEAQFNIAIPADTFSRRNLADFRG
jgi:outer membrane lipoprotein-sorting protein